ncbi:hypothetical protein CbuG_1811 [Coxiella burnetii CbuG_Q212]|nr:hypothetical protein CbuG_1811 [Coxiella burnetii CbuG_Q212]
MKKLKFLTVVTGAFLFSSIALAAPQIGLRDLQSGTAGFMLRPYRISMLKQPCVILTLRHYRILMARFKRTAIHKPSKKTPHEAFFYDLFPN